MSTEALFFLGVSVVVVAGTCGWLWVLWQLLSDDDEPVISQADRDHVERERQDADRKRAWLDASIKIKGGKS